MNPVSVLMEEEQTLSQIETEIRDIDRVLNDIGKEGKKTARFGSSTVAERHALRDAQPKATVNNTKSHLNTWNEWIQSLEPTKRPSKDLEKLDCGELSEFLEAFVSDVRRKDGDYYIVSSLINKVCSFIFCD